MSCLCVLVCIHVLCVRFDSLRISAMTCFVLTEHPLEFSGVCVCFGDGDQSRFCFFVSIVCDNQCKFKSHDC